MAIFKCDNCDHSQQNVPDKHLGKKGKCPKCQTVGIIKAKPSGLFNDLPSAFKPQGSATTSASVPSKPNSSSAEKITKTAIFKCDNCGHSQNVSDKLLGKKAKCPKCQTLGLIQAGTQKTLPSSPTTTPTKVKKETSTPPTSSTLPSPSSNISFADYLNQVATVSRKTQTTENNVQPSRQTTSDNFAGIASHIDNWLSMFNQKTSQFAESLTQLSSPPAEEATTTPPKPSATTSPPKPAKAKSTPPPSAEPSPPVPVTEEAINDIEPLVKWFYNKGVKLEVVEADRDNAYFFEVALQLGDHYEALEKLIKQIRWSLTNRKQSNGKATINFSSEPPPRVDILRQFCQELYQRAFLTERPRYPGNAKVVLHLQNAPKINRFFTGAWLEQYVFAKLISLFSKQSAKYACLRSFLTIFPNHEGKFEADVFLLFKNVPLWIECKSGEFRKDIEKYSKIRAKLGLRKDNLLLIVLGISDKDAQGMTSMFDITVVNEKMFMPHIAKLFNLPE